MVTGCRALLAAAGIAVFATPLVAQEGARGRAEVVARAVAFLQGLQDEKLPRERVVINGPRVLRGVERLGGAAVDGAPELQEAARRLGYEVRSGEEIIRCPARNDCDLVGASALLAWDPPLFAEGAGAQVRITWIMPTRYPGGVSLGGYSYLVHIERRGTEGWVATRVSERSHFQIAPRPPGGTSPGGS